MLVLTRKLQEKIQIGQDVTITILRVRGRSVRIGIEAPKGVRVMRAEIPMNEFGDEPSHEATAVQPPHVAEAATASVGRRRTSRHFRRDPFGDERAAFLPYRPPCSHHHAE